MTQKDVDGIMVYFDQTYLSSVCRGYQVSRSGIKSILEKYLKNNPPKYGKYCSICKDIIPEDEEHAFDSDNEDNPLILMGD